jgi:hypothetical protein
MYVHAIDETDAVLLGIFTGKKGREDIERHVEAWRRVDALAHALSDCRPVSIVPGDTVQVCIHIVDTLYAPMYAQSAVVSFANYTQDWGIAASSLRLGERVVGRGPPHARPLRCIPAETA